MLAFGLDPGLGWAHRDAPYRNSAALDLLEAIRPTIDHYVLRMLDERTFSRREFVELPSGQVRLAPKLARLLAESTIVPWEYEVAPVAERVARILATGASGAVRVPSGRSRGGSGIGRGTLGRRSSKSSASARSIKTACRECGVILERSDRDYCDECLPTFKSERTGKLVVAARKVLAEMRASEADPARSPEAKAKRVASNSKRRSEALAWERVSPGPHDRGWFTSKILPQLQHATLPQMMAATGLTSGYCWRIRRGDRIPHPMYWVALKSLGEESET